MNMTQIPFLVEGILLLVAMGLGLWLRRKGKPYGKVKTGFHLFFFLWFTMGYYYVASSTLTGGDLVLVAVVVVMGLALMTQLATGVTMLVSKAAAKALPVVHGTAATVLLVVDLAAVFLAGNRS